jgi:hypothetical protein
MAFCVLKHATHSHPLRKQDTCCVSRGASTGQPSRTPRDTYGDPNPRQFVQLPRGYGGARRGFSALGTIPADEHSTPHMGDVRENVESRYLCLPFHFIRKPPERVSHGKLHGQPLPQRNPQNFASKVLGIVPETSDQLCKIYPAVLPTSVTEYFVIRRHRNSRRDSHFQLPVEPYNPAR